MTTGYQQNTRPGFFISRNRVLSREPSRVWISSSYRNFRGKNFLIDRSSERGKQEHIHSESFGYTLFLDDDFRKRFYCYCIFFYAQIKLFYMFTVLTNWQRSRNLSEINQQIFHKRSDRFMRVSQNIHEVSGPRGRVKMGAKKIRSRRNYRLNAAGYTCTFIFSY